ncbi:MAG: radical SAM protein [Nannocystis sp.]|nr:radical SAM protein [Nannocystis sp.]
MKALLKVGYRCNDHCSFCHTLEVRHIDGSAAEVDAKIHRAAALGHSMVVLSGGEPTMRPELLHWARLVAAQGLDLGLVTNGRMLAYPQLVDQLIEQRLRYVYLSLHGGSAKIHNLMVRSDAFEQTYGALANLSGRGLDLHVNCVVTRHNVEHLCAVVDALRPYPDASLKFSMVEPKGGGSRLFDHLMPPVAHVAARVREAFAYAAERAPSVAARLRHGAIPLCLMSGLEDRFDDLKTHAYRTMIEVGEPDFYPVDDHNKLHPPACDGCALRGPCPGLYRGYHEVFGERELQPRRAGLRANSYNYTLDPAPPLTVADDAHCPLRDGPLGVTPWDRGRDLFIRHRGKVARYRAGTRDFNDAELVAIKHQHGQLYVDVGRGPASDDFARDLVKLARAPLCAACPHHDRCTGLYEPQLDHNLFRDADALVRDHLAQLRGDVIDLGCGQAPYADALAPHARAGRLTYLGLDPDPRQLALLRRRWPWAELKVGAAEQLADPRDPLGLHDRRFDHALMLRSWNHLRDPLPVLKAIFSERLRPGGTLTVVDNTAFGLARAAAQARRAEASPAGHEHFRNDSAADAARTITAAAPALSLVSSSDIAPATANQWLLIYRAP